MQHNDVILLRILRPARTAKRQSETHEDYDANSMANHSSERDDITVGMKSSSLSFSERPGAPLLAVFEKWGFPRTLRSLGPMGPFEV
jgi:hypothetical protein